MARLRCSRRRVPAVRELGTRIPGRTPWNKAAIATLLSTFPLLLPLEARCWINNVHTVVCACCASAGASPPCGNLMYVRTRSPMYVFGYVFAYQVVIYPVFLGLVYGVTRSSGSGCHTCATCGPWLISFGKHLSSNVFSYVLI